jgi:hypothetical protein
MSCSIKVQDKSSKPEQNDMPSSRWYLANALAGYLDFCMGTLIAAVCAAYAGQAPTVGLLLWGALFALLPDVDLVWPILRGHVRAGYDHRVTLMHRPLFVLVLTCAAVSWSGTGLCLVVALLGLVWHYLHDTPDGVAWLWPFSARKFLEPQPGQPHEKWVEETWCQFSRRGIGEVTAGTVVIVSTGVLLIYQHHAIGLLAITIGVGTTMTAAIFWSATSLEGSPA